MVPLNKGVVASTMSRKAKLVALLSGTQTALVTLFSVFLLNVDGKIAAISMLLGGFVGIVSGLFLAIKVFSGGVIPTSTFLQRYYSGHMLKLVLITVMLVLIYKFIEVDALTLIIGLCVTQIVYLLILPFIKRL